MMAMSKAPLMARPEWRRKARETLVDGALQDGLMGVGGWVGNLGFSNYVISECSLTVIEDISYGVLILLY